ncbi:hypothetical protein TSAR_002800 [Trichomalopsis sarcophagae]|uniref:Uncharacterized protein n=1 Tax=Trichomalopsis sarcophagae TaxID=543379 RepID=A0A232EDP5_9HYME|nr:hypothetical protein TSAR_002800 [Trichomalopsis sarcophagae]
MWPIQIRIPNIPESAAEVVGIDRGSGKPSSAKEFFKPSVDELLDIFEDGLEFCGSVKIVYFRCLIADGPARAFVLDHCGHNSTAPCSRCWIRGWCLRAGVMVYEGTVFVSRTEEEYSSRVDILHHKGLECPIGVFPINQMSSTVFDYMHLVYLGVMEKIFQGLIDGKFSKSAKLSSAGVQVLANRLEKVKEYCPDDFARKPVNVLKHGKFKATEHRQIQLYSGPVIFYGLLNSDALYKHFLLLHVAIRILSASEIYGIESLSYNVHSFLHLAGDIRSFGSLDSYSAFSYENNMSYFRKLCRKPNQPLQQIANRRAENCQVNVHKHHDKNSVKFIGAHSLGSKPPFENSNYSQYRKVVQVSYSLSISKPDGTIILRNGAICVIQNIIQLQNECYLLVKRFLTIENFFDLPCCSSTVDVFLCSRLSSDYILVSLEEIDNKCFRMPYWQNQPTLDMQSGYFMSKEQFKEAGVVPANVATARMMQKMMTLQNAANTLHHSEGSKNLYRSMSELTSSPKTPSNIIQTKNIGKSRTKPGILRHTQQKPLIQQPFTQQQQPLTQ